jgi:Glyoxalase-like domain
MSNSLFAVTIDCAGATVLGRFWADVLGRQIAEDSTSQHVVLLPAGGGTSGPRIVFNHVPEPKVVKNWVHLDLISDTFEAETKRLLSLGARRLRDLQAGKSRWTTLSDIEGTSSTSSADRVGFPQHCLPGFGPLARTVNETTCYATPGSHRRNWASSRRMPLAHGRVR